MSAPPHSDPQPRPRSKWWRRLAWAWVLIGLPLTVGGLFAYYSLMPGAVFLARMTDTRPEADYAGGPFTEAQQTIDLDGVRVLIRSYVPPSPRRTVLFVHGVHYKGMNEPRIVAVARKLAGVGIAVVTPQITPLTDAAVTPAAVDRIELSARWLLDTSGLVRPGERIGLMGICFGGGLTITAAGRASIADRIAFTFAIGAHAKLRPVARYLVQGTIEGRAHTPDPYGTAAILKEIAARVVPAEQVAPLRALLDRFLRDGEKSAHDHLHELPQPAREIARQAIDGELGKLAPTLMPHLDASEDDPSLSPALCPPPRCPVFLLHARGDNVIPREQAWRLKAALESKTKVEVLVTPLFEHVDIQGGGWSDKLALAAFITRMLRS